MSYMGQTDCDTFDLTPCHISSQAVTQCLRHCPLWLSLCRHSGKRRRTKTWHLVHHCPRSALLRHVLLTVSPLLALTLRFCPSRGDAWRARTIPCYQKRPHVWPGKWPEPELHGQHHSWGAANQSCYRYWKVFDVLTALLRMKYPQISDFISSDLWVSSTIATAIDTGVQSGISYAIGEVSGKWVHTIIQEKA